MGSSRLARSMRTRSLIGFAAFGHRVMEARHLRGIQRRTTASGQHETSAERWRRSLLTCGILASVLYVAMTLLCRPVVGGLQHRLWRPE